MQPHQYAAVPDVWSSCNLEYMCTTSHSTYSCGTRSSGEQWQSISELLSNYFTSTRNLTTTSFWVPHTKVLNNVVFLAFFEQSLAIYSFIELDTMSNALQPESIRAIGMTTYAGHLAIISKMIWRLTLSVQPLWDALLRRTPPGFKMAIRKMSTKRGDERKNCTLESTVNRRAK